MSYNCKICNKNYSSYKSLWFHNYKYHKQNVTTTKNDVQIIKPIENVFKCSSCNKIFNTRQSKSRHQLHYCKIKKTEKNIIEELTTLHKKIINENNELKKENTKLNMGEKIEYPNNKLDEIIKGKIIEILDKDKLKDTFLKKQKRKNYPGKYMIYMLTTEEHKKNRNYIIGKTKNLKDRLSGYNKTLEHEVVYYKSTNSQQSMNIAEILILKKLRIYEEKSNRDRFILPIDKDISLFTNIIDNCIEFVN